MPPEVHELVSSSAARYPERAAICRGDLRVSYASLESAANRLAAELLGRGLKPLDLVGLLLRDGVEMIVGMLAVLKAGGAFVPLDERLPPRRLMAMLREAPTRWFIVDPPLESLLGELLEDRTQRADVLRRPGEAGPGPAADPAIPRDPDGLCSIFFTSGSSGAPKPIAGRLKGIAHFARWQVSTFGLDETTRSGQIISPGYDAVLRDIFTPLVAGGTVHLPPSRDLILDPAALVRWLDAEAITLLHAVPSLFRRMAAVEPPPGRLAALRHVFLAGEPLLPADVARWRSAFGMGAELVNLYGPSETTMVKLAYRVRAEDSDHRFIPIGKPIDGARAIVCDPEMKPCATGMVGELYIRTPYRTLGYYRRPEQTAAVFLPNPFGTDPDDLIYKTGDLARLLDDGNFEYLGRADRQVKIRGARVELTEVERALLEHPSVRDAAVVDREDEAGDRHLAAYLVLSPAVETAVLRGTLSQSLPETHIPTTFVVLDALPRSISGKIELARLPRPQEADADPELPYEPPRTPAEQAVATVWEEMLQIRNPSVNYHFFAVGGHSLLAMQFLNRVESALGVTISLQDFLAEPNIRALALKVDEAIATMGDWDDELPVPDECIPDDSRAGGNL